jgi:hypothetical protein
MGKGSDRRQGEDTVKIDNNRKSAFPKINVERDKKYIAWISSLPCLTLNRGCSGDVVAHHIKRRAECSDYETIPLCYHHHVGGTNCVHSSRKIFEGTYNVDLKEEAERLKEEWDART